jgi:hypothetical protein
MRMSFNVMAKRHTREDIIPRYLKAHMIRECMISEEIIAVFGAIPSSIIIYFSVCYDLFPRTASQITYVLAIAMGGTIALHLEALRVLVRPRKAIGLTFGP